MTKHNTPADHHPTHDSGYKLLYSHVPMVRDLIQQGSIPGAWANELDFST